MHARCSGLQTKSKVPKQARRRAPSKESDSSDGETAEARRKKLTTQTRANLNVSTCQSFELVTNVRQLCAACQADDAHGT